MAKIEITIPDWLDKICAWPVMVYRKHAYGSAYRRIYLGEGEWTIVDPDVYYRLGRFKWSAAGEDGKMYAARILEKTVCGRIKTMYLHREIMNPPEGLLVDHENNNILDNRRANLRLATYSQNACNSNSRIDKSKTVSRFRGLVFLKRRLKWGARIGYEGKVIWLGTFDSEIDAALAYDAAARKYHGEFARLNFPDNTPFAVENGKSKIENRASMIRHCQTIVCYFLLAMLIVFGCTPPDRTRISRGNDMATAKMALKDAKAQNVWKFFRQISAIPRCSKNEGRILNWLKDFAKSRNLAFRSDAVGNLVIELPATKGYEKTPAVVLQSHVDMVCEKTPESKHDFSKDPIEIIERDGWVTADGTTLGADDGLGVSLALALADEKILHSRLELLFTVDEETGLTGANGLEQGFITGKYLINLDGEDESLIVGCAGGELTEITLKTEWVNAPDGLDCFDLKVSGLHGGHSGVDIDKKRANAIKILAKTLQTLLDKSRFIGICSIDAGKAANAIPRDAQAIVCFDPSHLKSIKQQISDMEVSFRKEFSKTDPGLKVELEKTTLRPSVSIRNPQSEIINLLSALPTGVYRMSDEFKGTVETSNNLARVETARSENHLSITTMQRSFKTSAMDELTGKITEIAKQAGAEVKTYGRYPGWEPDTSSNLLKKCTEAYVKLHGKTPPTRVVHAGLEPAIIKQKFPDMEAISVGPTIENPHSPQERLNIASVDAAWNFLLELIPSLK